MTHDSVATTENSHAKAPDSVETSDNSRWTIPESRAKTHDSATMSHDSRQTIPGSYAKTCDLVMTIAEPAFLTPDSAEAIALPTVL